jgi:hypothetical protein
MDKMTIIDWLVGAAFIVGGSIVYWSNYKIPERKRVARVGLGIVVVRHFAFAWAVDCYSGAPEMILRRSSRT